MPNQNDSKKSPQPDKAYFSFEALKKDVRAIDAREEAQRIAFSPMVFCAVDCLIKFGVLKVLEDAPQSGLSISSISSRCEMSFYAASVLCEIGLLTKVLIIASDDNDDLHYLLGKTGWMLLNDELTKVNFNFVRDVCYRGGEALFQSLKKGSPEGLKVFGDKWKTVYDALSELPPSVQKSWFEFDHYYSSVAFPEALPIVFFNHPKRLCDIGGNTAKWAVACCEYDTDVRVTIVDLPGQTAMAERTISEKGLTARIETYAANILSEETTLPQGQDVFWMSQFLDCFSLEQVTKILEKVYNVSNEETSVFVLEPLWDKQRFMGNAYSLVATSLYFSSIANGSSKMYRYNELVEAVERAGFLLKTSHHNLGRNSYTLLEFRKKGDKQ